MSKTKKPHHDEQYARVLNGQETLPLDTRPTPETYRRRIISALMLAGPDLLRLHEIVRRVELDHLPAGLPADPRLAEAMRQIRLVTLTLAEVQSDFMDCEPSVI